MKHWIARLAMAQLTACACAGLAQASPIVEDFDYAAGSALASQNGGSGWQGGPWSAADTFSVAAGSLSYAGLSSSGNRAVYLNNNFSSASATRRLVMGADGSTLWLSFLMSADGNADGLVSELLFQPTSGNNLRLGKLHGSDSAWGVQRDNGAAVLSTTPIVAGQAALFVMRFDFNADPTADDTVSIYVDPPAGSTPEAPLATYANNNFGSLFTSMQWLGFLDTFNATPGAGSSSLDAIRGGASYADVAPAATTSPSSVPEPSSLALLVLGLGVALGTAHGAARK